MRQPQDTKEARLSIRLSREQMERWERAARIEDRSVASLIRVATELYAQRLLQDNAR